MVSKSWITVPIDQEIGDVPTSGHAPYFFPIAGGTALFRFTADEFTEVLSSLINGAALTYPDKWIQVVWYFLRSMEFPVSICEQIIECLTNDVDVQNSLASMLTTNQTFNTWLNERIETLTAGQISTKLITGGDCVEANVAGRVKAIVDGMHQANIDWFQKIEVGTNDEEKFALAIEAIPILGELPIDQIIEFAEDILEDFTENYEAQVDTTLLEIWYCGLFCIAMSKPDCSLTYGDIYEFFSGRTTSGLNVFSALSDVIAFIRTGDFSGGTKVADGTMMLQAGLMVNGRSFMGSSLPTIAFSTRDAPPASFWETCAECPDDDLWLVAILDTTTYPDSIELISSDETTQVWRLKSFASINYLTGGAVSSNASQFYIHSVVIGIVDTGVDARFVLDSGTYDLGNVPCEFPTDQIWIYNALPNSTVDVTLKRTPCVDAWGVEYFGEVLSQNGTTVTGRGLLTPDSGGLYQLELKPITGCLTVTGGTLSAEVTSDCYYTPCADDSVPFTPTGLSIPAMGSIALVAFSSANPFEVVLNYTL